MLIACSFVHFILFKVTIFNSRLYFISLHISESQKTKLSTGVSLVPSGASVLFGVAGMSSYVALGHLFSTP